MNNSRFLNQMPRPMEILSCFFLLLSIPFSTFAAFDGAMVLISFKHSSIETDPSGSLQNWSRTDSSNPCSWIGVICSPEGLVHGLNLSNLGLIGHLRLDDLMALPSLKDVDLHGNLFYGNLIFSGSPSLPCSLETLDLSNNNFAESIPESFLRSCKHLVSLNLSRNLIPGGIFPFTVSLRQLDLSQNLISDSGLLRYALSNCRNLNYMNFSDNHLTGELVSASSCVNLEVLDLSYNMVSGEIPPEFFLTLPTSLKQLDLSRNDLSGIFSRFKFGSCKNIVTLDLSYNVLNGSGMPASLANCHWLERLDISNNYLEYRIPSFLGYLSNLKQLSLANNQFSGEIPLKLGRLCGMLRELDLSGNMLTGGLPSTFISCSSSLQSLDLGDNLLWGDFIEAVVSKLASLRYLHLPFNNITGLVPLSSLANCTFLEVIDLSSNGFTGNIPTGFCSSLSSLQQILLPNNLLSGTIPAELGNCTNLGTINLSFNDLRGPIPLEVWSLPKLVDLVMWANNLSGKIPENLCSNNTRLERLILNHNVIGGSIPSSINQCLKLVWVSLTSNRLSGRIPVGIGKLQSLTILQLGSNMFFGDIPMELGNGTNLIWLDLSSNGLTGAIPHTLASRRLRGPQTESMPREQLGFIRTDQEGPSSCLGTGSLLELTGIRPNQLENSVVAHSCPSMIIYTVSTIYTSEDNGSMIYLDISHNSIWGTIPENWGSMNYLWVLNLGHNDLTGSIPASLGGLSYVETLDLSHNHLTGFIPEELGKLTFLSYLDVSNNNLAGPIPELGQLATFTSQTYENNSGLCGFPLNVKCQGDHEASQGPLVVYDDGEYNDDGSETIWVGYGLGSGFVVGLWAVWVVMLFKTAWRHAYFRFTDNMCDRVYVVVAVNVARLRRK